MKKKNVINLIRFYVEKNDSAFRNEAEEIARDFYHSGDEELSRYIAGLLSNANYFVPQSEDYESEFLIKYPECKQDEMLLLPDVIMDDLTGIINAVKHNVGINKFLFEGEPGTGKTEASKKIAELLGRDLYIVQFESLIDSKLGQTQKNLGSLFSEINSFSYPERVLVLFDEIDSIALDRNNSRDLREMGRVASTLLKEIDRLNDQIVLIATTNLYKSFDKAILRRFDYVVHFDRYTENDLKEIATTLLNYYLKKFHIKYRNARLFQKMLSNTNKIPNPGDLKNIIRSSLAFADTENETAYLSNLYKNLTGNDPTDIHTLKLLGFSLREIEQLTGTSKSTLSRTLRGTINE